MQTYTRVLFGTAALFNFAVAAGLWFMRPALERLLQLDPVTGTNVALIKITAVLIAGFGVAYACAAWDARRYRPFIWLGALGKLAVVATAAGSWLLGEVGAQLPALAGGDLLFAILFLDYLRRTRDLLA
jgi:hypothetical protein